MDAVATDFATASAPNASEHVETTWTRVARSACSGKTERYRRQRVGPVASLSQGGGTGSNPVRAAKNARSEVLFGGPLSVPRDPSCPGVLERQRSRTSARSRTPKCDWPVAPHYNDPAIPDARRVLLQRRDYWRGLASPYVDDSMQAVMPLAASTGSSEAAGRVPTSAAPTATHASWQWGRFGSTPRVGLVVRSRR